MPAKKRGRRRTAAEIERLVLMMSAENTGWGSIRISGELRKLGIRLNRTTILDICLGTASRHRIAIDH